jgi:hypothetical protein
LRHGKKVDKRYRKPNKNWRNVHAQKNIQSSLGG